MSPANPLPGDQTEAGALEAAPEEGLSLETSAVDLFARKDEWLDLWRRVPSATFTQGPAWAEASWQVVSSRLGRQLLCVVGRTEGRLTMLWPLVTYRDKGLTIARPLGPEAAEYSSVLIEPAPNTTARVAATLRLLRRESGCDLLLAPKLAPGSPLEDALAAAAARIELVDHHAVVWDNVPDFRAYLTAQASRKHRQDHRRDRRRLAELGTLSFEQITDPARRLAAIDWTLDCKSSWLAERGIQGPWRSLPAYRSFLQRLAGAQAAEGRLGVFTLMVGGRIAACLIGTIDATRLEAFVVAYDPEFGKHSPGRMLFEDCLEWCFDARLGLDLRVGDEPYKTALANHRGQIASYVMALSAKSWARFLSEFAPAHLGIAAKQSLRRRLSPAGYQKVREAARQLSTVGRSGG